MANDMFGPMRNVYSTILSELVLEAKMYSQKYPVPVVGVPDEVDIIMGKFTDIYFYDDKLMIYNVDYENISMVLHFDYDGKEHTFLVRFGDPFSFVSENRMFHPDGYFISPGDEYTSIVKRKLIYKAMGILFNQYYQKLMSKHGKEFWYLKVWNYCKETHAKMAYKGTKKYEKQIVYEAGE